jgi:hypothetical protein
MTTIFQGKNHFQGVPNTGAPSPLVICAILFFCFPADHRLQKKVPLPFSHVLKISPLKLPFGWSKLENVKKALLQF